MEILLKMYFTKAAILLFSKHNVDKDIIPTSNFLQNADYSGLENCTHINSYIQSGVFLTMFIYNITL